MSFNEKILNDYDESVDDEYEREVLYRATAISYVWTMNLMFIASAVLAWVLPEMYSMWAVMPMGVLIFAMAVRDSWLRKRVPSPRPTQHSLWKLLTVIVSVMVVGGIYWNTLDVVDHDFSRGLLVGGVIGIVVVLVLASKISAHQRQRDRERLDAQLGED